MLQVGFKRTDPLCLFHILIAQVADQEYEKPDISDDEAHDGKISVCIELTQNDAYAKNSGKNRPERIQLGFEFQVLDPVSLRNICAAERVVGQCD